MELPPDFLLYVVIGFAAQLIDGALGMAYGVTASSLLLGFGVPPAVSSATVHAGLGGARSTTTVDMSRTYLEWAERNLRLNGLTGRAHRLIQADCLAWLREANEQFDLIFIDPPTFSNSKRMEDAFDVQRDHLALMKDLKRLLRAGGTIMFSNNKRGFRMDLDGLAKLGLKAQEITQKTLSQDFARNRQIHNCWLITAA